MIWLVGSGPMAVAYSKVLVALDLEFKVIGRGEASAEAFEEATGRSVQTGGTESYLASNPEHPKHVIVATPIETLAPVTRALLNYGVKSLLLEKPAGISTEEIRELAKLASEKQATVQIAYNRRFYASVRKAREIIEADGGVESFNFEFTEWSHRISKGKKTDAVLNAWLLANSSHVIDLAFFLGGRPREGVCYSAGQGELEWHPRGCSFSGAGVSEGDALFSYQANWRAPGRWGLEVLTAQSRLIFRPMEQLHIQKIGSIAIDMVEIDDAVDTEFKPGLYMQVKAFLSGESADLCPIGEQVTTSELCARILSGGTLGDTSA